MLYTSKNLKMCCQEHLLTDDDANKLWTPENLRKITRIISEAQEILKKEATNNLSPDVAPETLLGLFYFYIFLFLYFFICLFFTSFTRGNIISMPNLPKNY